MKAFYYDTVLDADNICNLARERDLLLEGIRGDRKMVVYGPRNCGKTSLVKSVVVPSFKKKNRRSFVLFADLMEVKDMASIDRRMHTGFERSFAESFPGRRLLEAAKNLIGSLRPNITLDPNTGQPSLSIAPDAKSAAPPFMEIFSAIRKGIAADVPTLIILDEFQDIAFVPEAQGLLRQALQEFRSVPIILMGSKRHILSRLFAEPQSPLAQFGEDIEFHPIPYGEYHVYMQERFDDRSIKISLDVATGLQDMLFKNPEAINIICAHLHDSLSRRTLNIQDVASAIEAVVERRQSRYDEWLSRFSDKEEDVLISLAMRGFVKYPTSQSFLKTVRATARTVSASIGKFLDQSAVEKTAEGYRISDPLLCHFLKRFR